MAQHITIGKLAKMSGISTRTIRHYEDIGLLNSATKTETNYRLYGEEEIKKLERILLFKSLGFSLEEIGIILSTEENQEVALLFENRLQEFEREVSEISRYKEMLKAISRIYKMHGLRYVNNYYLIKEMVGMNNMFVKSFNQLNLELQIKVLKEIYRTGSLSLETLKEMGVDQGGQLLKELHMVIVKVLLNKVDHNVEREIIHSLEETDPEFADRVKKAMFTFEDVIILPDDTIAKWLEQCDDQELAVALRESSKYVRNRLLNILPKNRAEEIEKYLKGTNLPTLDEVYTAMTNLVELLQKMEANGQIKIV